MASPGYRRSDARSATGRGDATGLQPPRASDVGLEASRTFVERRYLVDSEESFGKDLVRAYVASWPGILDLTEDGLVVRRRRKTQGRVGLVIGNGVGHEPAMLGLVGSGLFDVNVPGDVFAAPGPAAIARGIARADCGGGVLLCVSNHAGDVLSAEMAVELAGRDGVRCRMVVLGDDISMSRDDDGGRRGGPGLFFVWKTVGAAAEAGYDLDDCFRIARAACERTGSLSATLRGTVNPVTGQPTTVVPEGTILIGTGVHGDAAGSVLEWQSAQDVALAMLDRLVPAVGLRNGDGCLTMVNDAGAMSLAETALLHSAVLKGLASMGVRVLGSWMGRYATTLATAGFAIACCKADDELLRLWRAPCRSAAVASWGIGPVG